MAEFYGVMMMVGTLLFGSGGFILVMNDRLNTERWKAVLLGVGALLVGLGLVAYSTHALVRDSRAQYGSVADQFGRNTVSVECLPATGEGGTPTPCKVTRSGRLSDDDDTGRKVKYFAILRGGRSLEVSECLTRTPEVQSPLCEETYAEFFSLATNQRGLDIDLTRITEVVFISPDGGGEVVRVSQ